jgi:hypothetical protein
MMIVMLGMVVKVNMKTVIMVLTQLHFEIFIMVMKDQVLFLGRMFLIVELRNKSKCGKIFVFCALSF